MNWHAIVTSRSPSTIVRCGSLASFCHSGRSRSFTVRALYTRRVRGHLVLVLAIAACGDNIRLPMIPAEAGPGDGASLACTPMHGMHIVPRLVATVPGVPNGIPVEVAWPPDQPARMFVVSREGQIRLFDHEIEKPNLFLDVSNEIYTADTVERGLLGLVFHPRFATNGQFFIYYTTATSVVVARCTASADPDRANPICSSVIEILHDQAGNHNGGKMQFGADGYLYIGTGDGGGAGGQFMHAQDPTHLLGKILRIDVDHPSPGKSYSIPADNPFGNEVYILGLRNPWRWAFDRATNDLWIGDVGQNHAEELDVLRPAEQKGANLGWPIYEADACCATQDDHCYQVMSVPCDPTGLVFPKDVRDRYTPSGSGWFAIIGGDTYRGSCFPDLAGWHFYIDAYANVLVRAQLKDDGTLDIVEMPEVPITGISSIDADPRGELFAVSTYGQIYQLQATP